MIRGLTILELVVVGLITTLVISLGYNGVLMIQRVSSNKMELHEKTAALEKLNQIMKYNMLKADSVFWNSEDELLSFGEQQLSLSSDIVYLQNGSSDSLKLTIVEKEFLEIQLSEELKVVSSVKLTIVLDSVEVIIQGDKNYSDYFKEGLEI